MKKDPTNSDEIAPSEQEEPRKRAPYVPPKVESVRLSPEAAEALT